MKKEFNYIYLGEKWYQKLVRKIKNGAKVTMVWVVENKELVLVLVPTVTALIGGIYKGARLAINQNQLKQAQELKDLYVYDRHLGHYWKLKKPLSNGEWQVINQRMKMGEHLGDILLSMRVLG